MADLSDLQSADAVKIVGSSSAGVEQTPVQSTVNGDLRTADIVNTTGVEGALTVGTTAVPANVSGSNLSNRKTLTVYNNSNNTIYWGYTSGVTTSTGTPIVKSQFLSWDGLGDAVSVYLIAGGAGNNVRITEGA